MNAETKNIFKHAIADGYIASGNMDNITMNVTAPTNPAINPADNIVCSLK